MGWGRGEAAQGHSIFSWRSSGVCGSILLYCFSKNHLCGFRVWFHSGWDGKGSDLSATLLSPKVYATGGKLGFCIFSSSLGCSLLPCESAFSWAGPSQTLQAQALLDKEQLFGLGGSDHAPSCWYVELLFSGPTVAFNSDILRIRISRSMPVSQGCFPLHFNCKPPTRPCPLDSHAIPRWHSKVTHSDKDAGRLTTWAIQDTGPQDARRSPAGHYCYALLSQPQP